MADLDQGGTYRTRQRVFMGPSIGWTEISYAILRVTTGGITQVQLGNSVVTVNFNGLVTLQLPQFKGSTAGAIALPATFYNETMTLIDTGGFASIANPITINAGAGELISGLASIQITSQNGAFVLQPDPVNGGSSIVT